MPGDIMTRIVIGDSIAVGTAQAMRCAMDAREGAPSAEVLRRMVSAKGHDEVVISVGSNDPTNRRLPVNLAAIRDAVDPGARVVWIEPQNPSAAALVRQAARSGDAAVSFQAARDGVHPRSYATLARDVSAAFGVEKEPPVASQKVKVSDIGLAAIMAREGVRLTAYRDSVGVWTIGWGHTKGVKPGQKITRAQAEAFLREDIATHADPAFAAIKVPITQNEADALASIAFNIGVGGFKGSGFLRALNSGRSRAEVARQIMLWQKPPEVRSRREGERDQFLTPYSVRLPKARSNDASPVKVSGAAAAPKTISPVPIATDKPVVTTVDIPIETLPWWKRLIGLKPRSVALVGQNKGDEVLFRAQNRLLAAGYTEVGDPDGLWGPSTKTAVTLALADQFPTIMPPDDWPLSDEILASMVKLQRRKVAEARAGKTVAELRADGSTPVQAPVAMVGGGVFSGLLGIFGGVDQTGILDGVKGVTGQASEVIQSVQTFITTIISAVQWSLHHWWVFALVGAGWAIMRGLKYALEIRALYRQGSIRQAGL